MTLIRPASRPQLLTSSAERQERRRLVMADRRGSMLAALAGVRDVLVGADRIVAAGWVQEAWLVTRDSSGQERALGTTTSVRVETVTRACLVGAVVLAAGGPEALDAQPSRRAVEALWHALHRCEAEPADWCPAAVIHYGRARDLARWNDSPRTDQDAVRSLIARGQDVVARERERLLAA